MFNPRPATTTRPSAFTLVEFLVCIALLVVAMGLMVSLARYVRNSSAEDLSRDLLFKLDRLMDQYVTNNGHPPEVPRLMGIPRGEEDVLMASARQNNQAFLKAFYSTPGLSTDTLLGLPASCYDGASLHDAWGSVIVFMPQMDPAIGMSPKGWFFFSAGPDHRFLTREDNLYSYEGITHP